MGTTTIGVCKICTALNDKSDFHRHKFPPWDFCASWHVTPWHFQNLPHCIYIYIYTYIYYIVYMSYTELESSNIIQLYINIHSLDFNPFFLHGFLLSGSVPRMLASHHYQDDMVPIFAMVKEDLRIPKDTPPKTNMEPENGPLKQEIPIGNPPFSGSMLNFGGSKELTQELIIIKFCILPLHFYGIEKNTKPSTLPQPKPASWQWQLRKKSNPKSKVPSHPSSWDPVWMVPPAIGCRTHGQKHGTKAKDLKKKQVLTVVEFRRPLKCFFAETKIFLGPNISFKH